MELYMAERFMALWPLNIISDFDIRYCSLCIACEAYYDDGFYCNLLNNEWDFQDVARQGFNIPKADVAYVAS